MSFVLPVRKGGLGNQMFQVAAAMIYARETNRTVLLPKEFYNTHNSTKSDYSESIFREFIHRIDKALDDFAIHNLLQNGFVQHPGQPGFEDWSPIQTDSHIVLHGYFQNYPPIQRHEELIRRVYQNGLQNAALSYTRSETRVGIHIRRGDYLIPPHNEVLPVQPLSYYEKAIQNFPADTEFYIFSDDIEWCRQQDLFKNLLNKQFIEEKNEIKALACMTTCLGGFVCANSTFSWWGAFLGAYEFRKPIVVPSNWCKGGVGSLFPPEWICI